MPIQGFRRFRRHQVGKQADLSTPVAATRRLPYSGAIVYDPNWTDDDADVGSIDPVLAPYRLREDVTGTWQGTQTFNDLPNVYAPLLKSGVTAAGAGADKTWTFQTASLTADDFEYFTDEWGDDVTADYVQAFGGIITQAQWDFPDNGGPVTLNAQLRYAGKNYGADIVGTVPTAGLSVDANPIRLFQTDTALFIDDTFAAIGTTQFLDALHSARLTITNEIDLKTFANGPALRNQLRGYGRGARRIELSQTFAKTPEVLGEIDNLLADEAVNRFVELRTTSTKIITGVIPYSNVIRFPARFYTREDGERGNNTTITLVARAYYDAVAGYAFRAEVVNTRATL